MAAPSGLKLRSHNEANPNSYRSASLIKKRFFFSCSMCHS
jgi:hypothetical protein